MQGLKEIKGKTKGIEPSLHTFYIKYFSWQTWYPNIRSCGCCVVSIGLSLDAFVPTSTYSLLFFDKQFVQTYLNFCSK